MLVLEKFIGKGTKRICFEHPEDKNKCIKIVVSHKDINMLEDEIKTYAYVKSFIGEYLIHYEDRLIDTNLGKGLVCELLRDENGELSKSLNYYIKNHAFDTSLIEQLNHLAYKLVAHDIFFFDFNLNNFIIQKKRDGQKKLYFTDLKSYNAYKPLTFLHLEKILPCLSRYLMRRRLHQLFQFLEKTR